jgi:hypothetical protein
MGAAPLSAPVERRGQRADELSARFALAATGAGQTLERSYRIAGCDLRLRCAGRELLDDLSPPVEHLRVESAEGAGHLVELWDAASTTTEPPPPPRGYERLPPDAFARSAGDGWQAIYQPGPRILNASDTTLDRSWYWAADREAVSGWDRAAPLRHILGYWLGARGVHLVHAAAVGRPSGGVLIVGKSGSGKSTTSLSTLGSDLLFAGDDYVGVSLEPEGPYVHSIYASGKLETDHLARFPRLRLKPRYSLPGSRRGRREKTVFDVRDTYPDRLTTGFPLKAIVLPRISPDDTTELTGAPLAAALKAFMSTMFAFPAAGQDALTTLTQIAQQVRTLELRIGSDVDAIPGVLSRALERAA